MQNNRSFPCRFRVDQANYQTKKTGFDILILFSFVKGNCSQLADISSYFGIGIIT
jgi:hypothetical protein